jgi:hypothetical protein
MARIFPELFMENLDKTTFGIVSCASSGIVLVNTNDL